MVGKKLTDATNSFETAKGQLHAGKGNAVLQAQQMKALGAKKNKEITNDKEALQYEEEEYV